MDFAIACPCSGPRATVRRIRRSSVPCRSPTWSSASLVDIRPEPNPAQVECQGERKINCREPINSDFACGSSPPPAPQLTLNRHKRPNASHFHSSGLEFSYLGEDLDESDGEPEETIASPTFWERAAEHFHDVLSRD